MDFSTSIQNWYRLNKRDLPWRSDSNPYHIWLSEIILQQTRVEQGTPYYLKFVGRFKSVSSLANATEDEVLNLWQGLGYYSRARNLHAAAKTILKEYQGKFPNSYEQIHGLKGVGDYTAAAIASMAYNLPHAVVDGNVFRVLSRVYNISIPIDTGPGRKYFYDLANQILDKQNPGNHNQAVMELGSLVCLPTNPKCEVCPVVHLCLARSKKTIFELPVKKGKTKVTVRTFHYLVVTDGKKVVLKKRTDKDIWQGLYDFRLLESEQNESKILNEIKKMNPSRITKDGNIKHILSHQKILTTFWLVEVKKISLKQGEIAVTIADLDDYPMPRLLIRYLETALLTTLD